LDCTPTPPTPQNTCEFVALPAPSCASLGKPTTLTFRYSGGGCADSNNPQGGKATCSGSIDPDLPVLVSSTNSSYSITPSLVQPGQEFVVSASEFSSDSFFILSNGGGTENLKIHTSCSQLLAVGDIFGSLTLVAFNGQRASTEVTYIYEVTNLGDALQDVMLTDDPLGAIAGPFNLSTGESRTFQTTADIIMTTVNTGTFSGRLPNGAMCQASDTATVIVTEPCAACKGGTVALTFEYRGTLAANVIVYDDPNIKLDRILFQGLLQPGDRFSITPRPGQSRLNKDISIWIDGVLNARVHTSCSRPIGPGLIAGDFVIVSGRSRENGLMCPLNTCAPHADATFEFKGRELKWNVTNEGDLGLEISRITINWPTANGNLTEVKRGGDVIHKGNFAPPLAVIESGWEGNADKRTIKPGETNTLTFKFQYNASTQDPYSIVVDFSYGCSIEIAYP